jgi:hypothetical protein
VGGEQCLRSCVLGLSFDANRQRERKCRTLTHLRVDPDFAAVHFDDALRYGQSQTGAALLAGDGVVGLLELLEKLGLIGGRNARFSVTDGQVE